MIRPLSTASGKMGSATTLREAWYLGGETAILFVLFYLYVWLVVDPRLIHHSIGILTYYHPFSFHTGWAFFLDHLTRPGGVVEYAARFLSQCFARGWVGALLVTAAAMWGCWTSDVVSGLAGRRQTSVLRYVPAVLLLVIYDSYSQPLYTLLALITALAGFVVYVCWAPPRLRWRLPVLFLVGALLYHLAGAGSLLFLFLVALYEVGMGTGAVVAGGAVLCGLGLPWLARAIFSVDVQDAYGGFLVAAPGVLPERWPAMLALYIFFPGLLAGMMLWQAAVARSVGKDRRVQTNRKNSNLAVKSGAARHEIPTKFARPWRGLLRRSARILLVLLGGGAAAWLSLDAFARTVLEIDYYSQREAWTETLLAASYLPAGTFQVRCHRNVVLALYHTGRLGDELFRYPQRPGVDLFSTLGQERDVGTDYQESRLFLELGQVNQAEKLACETLETSGDRSAVLEELALINVVKGRPETARIFLNALAQQPFHQRAAREMLERLDADPRLDGDLRVSGIRRNLVAKDDVGLDTSVEDFLQSLLDKNPQNKMAFEFLVSHYLVIGRPDKVVACLGRLKDFAYGHLPRHYQEAAVIYAKTAGQRPRVPGYELDPEVLSRADAFAQLIAGTRSREDAARLARKSGFGDSYFYYLAFGTSGQ